MKKHQKLWRPCLVVLISLVMVLACVPMWAAMDAVTAEVAQVLGTVTVKRAASEKTFNAFVGLKLKQGDVVTVAPGGEVTINIGDDKTIKGLSDSSFKISSLSGTDSDSQVGFTLIKGTVFNEVRAPQSSTEGMTVRTGNTVAGVRGTTYTVSLRAADGVTVRTLQGSVFLDRVLGRIESDTNASLVTRQEVVEAGQGSGSDGEGVYALSISDFTAAELAYIVDNAQDFEPDLVTEARSVLVTLPSQTEPAPTQSPRIIYADDVDTGGTAPADDSPATNPAATEPGTTVPGTTNPDTTQPGTTVPSTTVPGTTVPSPPAQDYTITIHFGGSPDYSGYYGAAGTVTVPEGTPLGDALSGFQPGKLGHTLAGWVEADTGTQGVTRTTALYSPGDTTPVNRDYDLWPFFTDNGETGMADQPYTITAANFPNFACLVHENEYLRAHYTLAEDINYSDYALTWTPIGTYYSPFTGRFNGGEKTISSFHVEDGSQEVGFFGAILGEPGTDIVYDLTLRTNENGIVGTEGSVLHVGGLVGQLRSGDIRNCHVYGTITGSVSGWNIHVGGLVGAALEYVQLSGSDAIMSAAIYECTFTGTIRAQTTGGGEVSAGGIVGRFQSFSVMDCTASGNVSASGAASACSGGIVGSMDGGYFSGNRYTGASGAISATSTAASGGFSRVTAGGVAGQANTLVTESMASGTFTVTANGGNARSGGLVGHMGAHAGIEQCAVTGATVSASSGAGGSTVYLGGVAGLLDNNSDLEYAYASGVNLITDSTSARVGGIAGETASSIESCYVVNIQITVPDGASVIAGGIAAAAEGVYSSAVFSCTVHLTPGGGIARSYAISLLNDEGSHNYCVANGFLDNGSWPINGSDHTDHDGQNVATLDKAHLQDTMGWDFSAIWRWEPGHDAYPVLIALASPISLPFPPFWP